MITLTMESVYTPDEKKATTSWKLNGEESAEEGAEEVFSFVVAALAWTLSGVVAHGFGVKEEGEYEVIAKDAGERVHGLMLKYQGEQLRRNVEKS